MGTDGPGSRMDEVPTRGGDQVGQGRDRRRLGFGWGYLWIVLAFLLGGLVFSFGFLARANTEYPPHRARSLAMGLLLITSAYGLLRRRKLGLYLAEGAMALWILRWLLRFLQAIMTSRVPWVMDPSRGWAQLDAIGTGLIAIVAGGLSMAYFYRRRDWFR